MITIAKKSTTSIVGGGYSGLFSAACYISDSGGFMRTSPLLLAIAAALSGCSKSYHDTGCMTVATDAMSCPPGKDVRPEQLHLPGQCGDDLEIVDVDSDGSVRKLTSDVGTETTACCYTVMVVDSNRMAECAVGRPYFEGQQALRAAVRDSSAQEVGVDPSARARAWAAAGADEHASVAAFSRLSLVLMAHGAPTELLCDVHQAALDELGHAELCWSVARRFGAAVVGAGAFPFTEAVSVQTSLAAVAASAVREGCLAETLGAHLAAAAAELAPEPDVKAALSSIAAEEARHAVLSFRIVAWALRAGGPEVEAAVRAAFDGPWPRHDIAELALRANVAVPLLQRAAEEGAREVLEPARALLLMAPPARRPDGSVVERVFEA
jgi:hypothetical protein